MDDKGLISAYKVWYKEKFQVEPTPKLIEKFCKMNNIDYSAIKQFEEAKQRLRAALGEALEKVETAESVGELDGIRIDVITKVGEGA